MRPRCFLTELAQSGVNSVGIATSSGREKYERDKIFNAKIFEHGQK